MDRLAIVFAWSVLGLGLIAVLLPRLRRARRGGRTRVAVERFRVQREQLEARFFDMASRSGKPRGVTWVDIDWLDDVAYARDAQSGLLTAFAAVNVRFEPVAGGDLEDVEFVTAIRDATAVFHYQRGVWGTGGRVMFNMNPRDAVERLKGQYEPVELTG